MIFKYKMGKYMNIFKASGAGVAGGLGFNAGGLMNGIGNQFCLLLKK
jgi:hypothetical protein